MDLVSLLSLVGTDLDKHCFIITSERGQTLSLPVSGDLDGPYIIIASDGGPEWTLSYCYPCWGPR